jgi:uncharacterized protein (TIGR03067 family)
MARTLPARPNLEYLRTQAKTLLQQLRAGDSAAARTFSDYLPDAAGLSSADVRSRGFRLADAQAAIARKSGFSEWPCLARHVDRLRRMEGKWAFRSLEMDGAAVPADMLTSSFLLIDGDRFRMESPEANYEGIFTIDVEREPHGIDIDFVEGPEAGNRSEGLFVLEGDSLRICLGLVGSPRPTEFVTAPGSGHALELLERVEHARPAGVDGGTAPPPKPPVPVAVAEEAGSFSDLVTPVLEALQGEWTAVALIQSGEPLQESYLRFGSRLHTGAATKVIFGGQTMLHANMRAREGAHPLEIDYLHLSGKTKGAISYGIFQWEDDIAVFCTAPPGSARPTDFRSPQGSRWTLSKWKRKG